jgi:hypothetical protein
MNGNTVVPAKTWKKKQKELTARKYALCERYYSLRDEVRSVELLRKGTENIMQDDRQERQQPTRPKGMEL